MDAVNNLDDRLRLILSEGEGQKVEFKRGLTDIAPQMVAFANSSGGSIYIGVDDDGVVAGVESSNRLHSQIQDMAGNCDPPVKVRIVRHGAVVEVSVDEGADKPYRCKEGFFLRIGPNTQKLKRNEIRDLILGAGTFHWDEQLNPAYSHPAHLDKPRLDRFIELAHMTFRGRTEDLLLNMDVAQKTAEGLKLTNAGVLFFAREPQRFINESYCTAARYQGVDRFSIIDRLEITGGPIEIIEEALKFVKRNTRVETVVTGDGRHTELHEYPPVAVREAITNATMHRDYSYDLSHMYIHIFSDRLEIENPGGLPPGMTVEELGTRSVRRNRALADLLYRAGYVERLGSGMDRIKRSLTENGNPPFVISTGNFFVLRFLPRVKNQLEQALTGRQRKLLAFIRQRPDAGKTAIATSLAVSSDTALRELNALIHLGLIRKDGIGKATTYHAV